MSVIQDIWSGVKSIISGGVKIAVAFQRTHFIYCQSRLGVAIF